MTTKFLKPAAGLKVRDPVLKDRLPEGGRWVEMSPYWTRRMLDKDVEEAPAPETPPEGEGAAPPAKSEIEAK